MIAQWQTITGTVLRSVSSGCWITSDCIVRRRGKERKYLFRVQLMDSTVFITFITSCDACFSALLKTVHVRVPLYPPSRVYIPSSHSPPGEQSVWVGERNKFCLPGCRDCCFLSRHTQRCHSWNIWQRGWQLRDALWQMYYWQSHGAANFERELADGRMVRTNKISAVQSGGDCF